MPAPPQEGPPAAAAKRLGLLAIIGPGLLIAATGVGAGDLAGGAFAGMKIGTAVIWAAVLGAFLKFVLTEGLARFQIATGETLLEGAVRRLGPLVQWIFLPYLIVWSIWVGSAMMSACGATAHAVLPFFDDPVMGKRAFGIAHSVVGVILVRLGGYKLFEKIMSTCIALMFVTAIAAAVMTKPDWLAVLRGTFIPNLFSMTGEERNWTIALMGGVGGTLTVLCYGYWIREEGRDTLADTREAVRICRIDLAVGYIMTALFGIAMVIIGSQVTAEGKGSALVVNIGAQLDETIGPFGKWAFLIGAWGAVFSSLLGVWQAVPYIFADFWQLRDERKQTTIGADAQGDADAQGEATAGPRKVDVNGMPYRMYLVAIAVVPMLGLLIDFSRVQLLYQVIGAFFMPLLAVALMLLLGPTRWSPPQLRNHPLTMVVLALTLLFFGYQTVDVLRDKLLPRPRDTRRGTRPDRADAGRPAARRVAARRPSANRRPAARHGPAEAVMPHFICCGCHGRVRSSVQGNHARTTRPRGLGRDTPHARLATPHQVVARSSRRAVSLPCGDG